MSKLATRGRPSADRTSLYDEITGKTLAELEAGRLQWVQPWGTGRCQGAARHADAECAFCSDCPRLEPVRFALLSGAKTGKNPEWH